MCNVATYHFSLHLHNGFYFFINTKKSPPTTFSWVYRKQIKKKYDSLSFHRTLQTLDFGSSVSKMEKREKKEEKRNRKNKDCLLNKRNPDHGWISLSTLRLCPAKKLFWSLLLTVLTRYMREASYKRSKVSLTYSSFS